MNILRVIWGWLHSRSVWVQVAFVVLNGLAVTQGWDANTIMAVNSVLAALGIHFRVNPRQQF